MTSVLFGTEPTRFVGGPYDGVRGEVVGSPMGLAVGPDGGFTYLRAEPMTRDKPWVTYRYDAEHSPLHKSVIEADRQAIEQIMRDERLTVDEVMAKIKAARLRQPGQPSPAQAFISEAERLGVSVADLLAMRAAEIAGEA